MIYRSKACYRKGLPASFKHTITHCAHGRFSSFDPASEHNNDNFVSFLALVPKTTCTGGFGDQLKSYRALHHNPIAHTRCEICTHQSMDLATNANAVYDG